MATTTTTLSARTLARIFALALALATLLALTSASQSQAWYVLHPGAAPPWTQSLSWSAAQWYAWALFVPAAAALAWRFNFSGTASRGGRIVLHVAFAIAFAVAHLLLQTALLFLLPSGREFFGTFESGVLTLLVTTLQWELLSYAIVVAAVHSLLYLRRAQAEALARRESEAQAARAQLSALKRQMQPHFLFNALNALVAMQGEDSPAQRFTIRLSELLRMLLDTGDRSTSTLADELRMVEAYLQIERARLGARLRMQVDVPEALRATALPAFILQPLVENAITHGIAADPDGGEIRVGAQRDGANVAIEIVNSSRTPAATHRGNGVALDNCRQRLQLLYGAAAQLEAGPTAQPGFRAALTIPVCDPIAA